MRRAAILLVSLALAACGGAHQTAGGVDQSRGDVHQGPGGAAASQLTPPAAVDRTGLPKPAAAPEWQPPAVSTWTMPNGITVWYLKQDQAPLLSLRLVLPRGAATDPRGKAGLTALTADMLDEGAAGKSALELNEAFQRLATDYGVSPATDGVIVALDLLADTLQPSLALLADVLLRPDFPAEEFERRKTQHLARALAAEADPGGTATVVLRRVLFGHGYGSRPAGGVRSTLSALTLADVKAQYAAVFQPKGATLVAVGAVEPHVLKGALDQALGGWEGAPSAEPRVVHKALPAPGIYIADFPGSTQSSVTVARIVPGVDATDDYFAAEVFNRSLGGAFTSRLNLNLREDKGYTYGARAGFNRWRQAGFYGLSASVKADTTKASIDEMLGELRRVTGEKPVTAQERDEAVGGMLLGFPGRFERMASVAGQLASLALDGRDPDWYRQWPERVKATSAEDAQAAANRYAQPVDRFVIIVAGDRAALEPSLKALGLPIVPYDAQGNPIDAKAPTAKKKAPAKKKAAK